VANSGLRLSGVYKEFHKIHTGVLISP